MLVFCLGWLDIPLGLSLVWLVLVFVSVSFLCSSGVGLGFAFV